MEELTKIIYQIDWQEFFQVSALLLGFLGTIILAIPLLKTEECLDNDEIIDDRHEDIGDQEKYFYTRRGFLKDRKFGLWGLGLLGLGFFIQLITFVL